MIGFPDASVESARLVGNEYRPWIPAPLASPGSCSTNVDPFQRRAKIAFESPVRSASWFSIHARFSTPPLLDNWALLGWLMAVVIPAETSCQADPFHATTAIALWPAVVV